MEESVSFLAFYGQLFGPARIGRSSDGDRGRVLRAHGRRATKGRKGWKRTSAARGRERGGGLDNGSGGARGSRVRVFELRVLQQCHRRVGKGCSNQ